MRLESSVSRWSLPFTIAGVGALAIASSLVAVAGTAAPEQNKKPSISVKANPPVGFSPLRVVVTAELRGGADDFEDFYCATVEWDWGDDTKSETKADCDPYEPGKSEIKRRYAADHTFRTFVDLSSPNQPPSVQYRVRFQLKQKNKVVGSGQTTVEIRTGIGG